METFAKSVVEEMISKYGNVVDIVRSTSGDLFVLDNGVIIHLPGDFSRIPEVVVRLIAEVKLDLPTWEYDHWHGEQ